MQLPKTLSTLTARARLPHGTNAPAQALAALYDMRTASQSGVVCLTCRAIVDRPQPHTRFHIREGHKVIVRHPNGQKVSADPADGRIPDPTPTQPA